jgi:hypothetical protein
MSSAALHTACIWLSSSTCGNTLAGPDQNIREQRPWVHRAIVILLHLPMDTGRRYSPASMLGKGRYHTGLRRRHISSVEPGDFWFKLGGAGSSGSREGHRFIAPATSLQSSQAA